MCKKLVEVESLHGFTIDELMKIKNTTGSSYARILLTSIIMRFNGSSTDQIIAVTGKSNVSTIKHIRKWNKEGINAIKDHRGGSVATFTVKMEHDLIDTVLNKTPEQCDLEGYSWTCGLLADYIFDKYNKRYTDEWIRRILERNNMSYKRAQAKPTKADKSEQEAFKKNIKITTYFRDKR